MPMLVRLRWSALAFSACLALAGCTAQDTECLARIGRKLAERSHGAADTVREQVDGDLKALPHAAGLKEKIEARLRWDAMLADVVIEVRVNGNEVELKGTVKNEAQRRRAGDVAETTIGVQAVNDSLKVEE
jgi:osmotically-inducible protein OsmY